MVDDSGRRFTDFLKRLVRVPKLEIDAEERREARNKERRTTPKPAAPHGHIVPTIEPR